MIEKELYDLLNNAKINLDEYKIEELSSGEKQEMKNDVLKRIHNMEEKTMKNQKKKRTGWKIAGTAVAACLTIVIVGAGVNPVGAKSLLSKAFSNFISADKDTQYEEDTRKMYTKIGEESNTIEEEIEKIGAEQAEEETVLETTVADTTVRVKDIYCDGYTLIYTLEVDSKEAREYDVDSLGLLSGDDTIPGTGYFSDSLYINEMDYGMPALGGFTKTESGIFTSVNKVDLLWQQKSVGTEYKNGDTLNLVYTINHGFSGYREDILTDTPDEGGFYQPKELFHTEGKWELRFPVQVDGSQNLTTNVNISKNDVLLKSVTRTKSGLLLEMNIPDLTKEPYNDPDNAPDVFVAKTNGEQLQVITNYWTPQKDGSTDVSFYVLYNGEQNLKLEVINKNGGNERIASIPVPIPTGE